MTAPFRFAPPIVGPDALTRPRLLRPLLGRFSNRCTVLIAGAGHGKTTLLAQALAENRLAPRGDDVWLALEPADVDSLRIADDLLRALGAPSAAGSAAAVADAVWRRGPTEVCIVLDDVHELAPRSPGSAVVAELAEALPANGHLVLATRTTPAVPFARLAAHGSLLRFDEEELRFDASELESFASRRSINAATLAHTAGWPAMAQLVATSGSDLAGDFLWQEVLEPLGAGERHVFAVLCDLGGGDDELLSVALGEPVNFPGGLPLVAADADGWHQPHALWQSVDAIRLPVSERISIRRRAARELAARGRCDAAFGLLAGVELWDEVPPLLRDSCRAGARPVASQVRGWLSRSPASVVEGPAGQLASGVLAALTAPELAREPLRKAMIGFRDAGDADGELSAISHFGHVAWWSRDVAALAEFAPRVDELAAAGNPTARGLAAIGSALLCNIVGDNMGVLAALDAVPPGVLDESWEAVIAWMRALALGGLGDEAGFFAALEAARPLADPAFRVTVDASYTTARWSIGEFEDLAAEAAALCEASEAAGIAQDTVAVAASCARAFAYLGDVDAARVYLARAYAVSAHLAPPAFVHIALAEAAIAVSSGDEAGAAAILRKELDRHPNTDPRFGGLWALDVALTYVLLPELRPALQGVRFWRAIWTRELATAIVAGRESGHRDPVKDVDVASPSRVRAVLPFPFVAELAVRLNGAGRTAEAAALLESLGAPGRAVLRARNDREARSLLALVPAAPAAVDVRAFGPVQVGGRSLDRVRVRELLAFLLLHRATTRAAVTAALWPDLDDRAAANNLRVTLSYLLRVLEPERGDGEAAYFVRQSGAELRLVNDAALTVDLDVFDEQLATAATAERDGIPSVALPAYVAATELYRGDLFADLPEITWADLERDRFRARFVVAAVRAGELFAAANERDRAEDLARRALAVDEWSEPAYGVIASAALARGDRAGALRAIERSRDMLRELGVEPSEATLRSERLARGDA